MIHWSPKKGTLLVFFLLCSLIQSTNSFAQDDDYFEVYLDFRHRGIINSVVISYYDGDQFFLPLVELFNLFQIEANVDGLRVSGNYSIEQTPYSIDLSRPSISFGNENYELTSDQFYISELDYHFPPEIFSEIFGLNFSVDINNLSIRLETNKEIPIIAKTLRDQKRRLADSNRLETNFYPLEYGRDFKVFDGGFLDYSLSSNIQPDVTSFNYSSSIGLQLLGGDLQGNAFGNVASGVSALETNNLRWRTIIRETPWISTIAVGQSTMDGVFMNRYTGIRITNEPVEPRRFFDEFEIQGTTMPQSEIELYLNNGLIDFKQADELGNYRFLTPLFYGSSQLDLRIYGPTGQIVTQSSRIQVPFTFNPKGEFNYRINAGVLDNTIIGSTIRNKMFQVNGSYGLTKWLTSKVGVEYFSEEIGTGTPFYTAILSGRLSSNYIVSIEGVSNAYYRTTLNAIYPSAASINLDYTDFYAGESIFNSSNNDRQLTSSVFIPLRIFKLPFNFRLSNFSRSREGTTTNSIRLDVNTRINKLNLRAGYSDRLIDTFNPLNSTQGNTLEGSITYSISRNPNIPTVLRGTFLRGQLRFLPEQNQLQNAEFLFSKNVFKIGRLQVSMGRNFTSNFNTIRANFVIDFKRVRSNTTVTTIRNTVSSTQSFRGSIGYDPNFNNLLFTARDQVGRSGAAVQLFVDRNASGVYDEGDELLPDVSMRIGRNGSQFMYKNGVLYYTQMRPYFRYNMEMNTATIKNPMLVPELDKFSMITDPNSFKAIRVPFNVSGVMEGMVERQYNDGQTQGIGGLKVLLNEKGESETKELRTFSDGSFYEYPISPGQYNIKVDPTQLNLLQTRSLPEEIDFEIKVTPDGDYIEGINFRLLPLEENEASEEDSLAALTITQVTDEIKSSPEILEYSQEVFQEVDDALRRIIQAQNAFYSNNIDLAFRYVNESLELFETAQAHALKGSFYYFEGNIDQAQRHWEQALRFNPDLVIPDMEVLEERVNRRASD